MTDKSLPYAKKYKREIINSLLSDKVIEKEKTAIFMAGSPGAGKTESTQEITILDENLIVIDADQFRTVFPGYTGTNSDQFQRGSSLLVDAALDLVLKKGYSFVLDGTFATTKVMQNIERALNRDYNVLIYYVYQDPYIAWTFTKKRQLKEGRYVPKERFINAFFAARNNLMHVKDHFKEQVTINIILKDLENKTSDIMFDIDNIDLAMPIDHTKAELEANLHD